MEAMKEGIGFVGLGKMGQPMARNLLKAGYQLRVYNRDARKAEALVAEGAQRCLCPGDVVVPGGIVITMVSNDAALENVTLGEDGILEHLEPGGMHVVMSIISPSYTRKMTDLHTQRNCTYLAAPSLVVLTRPPLKNSGSALRGPPEPKNASTPSSCILGKASLTSVQTPPSHLS